jgi:hypothetical protein
MGVCLKLCFMTCRTRPHLRHDCFTTLQAPESPNSITRSAGCSGATTSSSRSPVHRRPSRSTGPPPRSISQAERGKRGLSLETLLELTGNLNMSIDELLRDEVVAGYAAATTHAPAAPTTGTSRCRCSTTRPQGYAPTSSTSHHGRPGLHISRTREPNWSPSPTLIDVTTIEGWRNLGPSEATLFWILRD